MIIYNITIFFYILNRNKYQSVEATEKYQEQNRIRQQRYREKLRSEKEKSNVTITENNEVEDNTQEKIQERRMRITMDLENTKYENCQKNFHNKCKFCGKDLKQMVLDYLYTNVSSELIEYERCTCKESKNYWRDVDFKIH